MSGLSAITRAAKDIYHDGAAKGLTHQADEAYYLDGQRLIYHSGTAGQEGAVYYPESDPFTKVRVHGTYNSTTANTWFEVEAANGMKYSYGNPAPGRLNYSVDSSPRIHAWYLNLVEDPQGNYMTYTYSNYDYVMYPASITYGGNKHESTGLQHRIIFSYESRSDSKPFSIDGNVQGKMSQRLKSIRSFTGNSTFRIYDLQYKVHLLGKGLLGMTSVTVNNTTLGTGVESGVEEWDTLFYIPKKTYTKTTVDGKTAETKVTLTLEDMGSGKYFACPSSQTDRDLDGDSVTITRQFNTSCGYLMEEKADYVNGMYKKTVLPDGNKITYHQGWNNKAAKRFFTLTQGNGQPWVKTWYDNCGREVLVETIGPKSLVIRQKKVYNTQGLVSQKQAVTGNL